MRLLLLLSALLGALTGVAGSRAQAQPVQASALATASVAGAAAVTVAARRFTPAPYATTPPLSLGVRPPVAAIVQRVLYAERRRE